MEFSREAIISLIIGVVFISFASFALGVQFERTRLSPDQTPVPIPVNTIPAPAQGDACVTDADCGYLSCLQQPCPELKCIEGYCTEVYP